MTYKLRCNHWNNRHAEFTLFDRKGANCGTITLLAEDVMDFIRNAWRGQVEWNGKIPENILNTATK